MRNLLAGLLLSMCAACSVARPTGLPTAEPWVVAVKSAGIPKFMPWYAHFAEHTWVDAKLGGEERWVRAEVLNESAGASCVSTRPLCAAFTPQQMGASAKTSLTRNAAPRRRTNTHAS